MVVASDAPRDLRFRRVGGDTEPDEVLVRLDGGQSSSVVLNTAMVSSKSLVDISGVVATVLHLSYNIMCMCVNKD